VERHCSVVLLFHNAKRAKPTKWMSNRRSPILTMAESQISRQPRDWWSTAAASATRVRHRRGCRRRSPSAWRTSPRKFNKISLYKFLRWLHLLRTVEESVEVVGAREMQNIFVVDHSESLLDCRPFTKKEASHILSAALSATRKRKTFSTSSLPVFLRGNFGLPFYSP